jgi:hypothetical protein
MLNKKYKAAIATTTNEGMTLPLAKAGAVFLAIGVNLLGGDVRFTHSKRLTPFKDARSISSRKR